MTGQPGNRSACSRPTLHKPLGAFCSNSSNRLRRLSHRLRPARSHDPRRGPGCICWSRTIRLVRSGAEFAVRHGLTPVMVPGPYDGMLTHPDEIAKAIPLLTRAPYGRQTPPGRGEYRAVRGRLNRQRQPAAPALPQTDRGRWPATGNDPPTAGSACSPHIPIESPAQDIRRRSHRRRARGGRRDGGARLAHEHAQGGRASARTAPWLCCQHSRLGDGTVRQRGRSPSLPSGRAEGIARPVPTMVTARPLRAYHLPRCPTRRRRPPGSPRRW